MGFGSIFTRADVDILKTSPGEPIKTRLIEKLHKSFSDSHLSVEEKLIAEEILRFLAADISVRIRQNIATHFCQDINLPYDIALKLANDLEDVVALPVIQRSVILKDRDLVAIIEGGNVKRQKAVAGRPEVSEYLASQIIKKAAPEAIGRLVENENVKLNPKQTESIISSYASNQPLMRAMISKKKISPMQAHELLTMVSADLRKALIVEYNIPSNVVNNLVHDSKETLILNMILSNMERRNHATLLQMISRLHDDNDLTFSVLIKALGFGNIDFFEAAIAKIVDLPVQETRIKLSHNLDSFLEIYTKARLPEAMAHAVYKLMLIAKDEQENQSPDAAKIYYRILNRLARTSNNEKVNNLDYLVTIVAYNLKKSNML